MAIQIFPLSDPRTGDQRKPYGAGSPNIADTLKSATIDHEVKFIVHSKGHLSLAWQTHEPAFSPSAAE
jgi:hypothetical protein